MLKTPYKTIYRVHSIEEALNFDIGKLKTDMLLWFVDLYDVLLSVRQKSIDPPSLDQILELRMKCTEYLLTHYHELYKPIPGVMLGWTTSMLLFVIILHLIHLQYESSSMYLSYETIEYIKRNRLRVYTNPDPETWCFATLVSFSDVIAFQWKSLEPSDELSEVLELCWRLTAKFTLNIHSKIMLNIESYTEIVKGMNDHARLSEKAMIMCMDRFYWFTSTLNYYRRWKSAPHVIAPNLKNTNWSTFILSERRHFVTRRFRDSILAFLWDKILLYGDKAVAAHNQLGEDVSAMTCLYQRSPAGQLNKLQKLITYDEYEDMIKYKPITDWIHLLMINQHFVNVYNVKFISFFFISEEKMYKHIEAIERSVVPIIFYRFNGFDVYFHGKIYTHPEGRSIQHALILWCYMIRNKCNNKAFNMDFSPVCEKLLDRNEEVNNERPMEDMFQLEDD